VNIVVSDSNISILSDGSTLTSLVEVPDAVTDINADADTAGFPPIYDVIIADPDAFRVIEPDVFIVAMDEDEVI
jgi:hypothetical protein